MYLNYYYYYIYGPPSLESHLLILRCDKNRESAAVISIATATDASVGM